MEPPPPLPGGGRPFPVGDAAVRLESATWSRGVRIEAPDLGSGLGIERDDAVGRGRQVEDAADDQGGALESNRMRPLLPLAGVVGPEPAQAGDVAAIDVGETGESGSPGIAPPRA